MEIKKMNEEMSRLIQDYTGEYPTEIDCHRDAFIPGAVAIRAWFLSDGPYEYMKYANGRIEEVEFRSWPPHIK